MNESEAKAKQQIIDKIKAATNILITVSRDPSVDELSAALGLTAFLNKIDKHATAIFSGAIPPAISFLEPDKVFEDTADSLRDFIIALDKEKADHLRYKLEGDVVKIFITPYRTTISENDLEFSQGDYNIELVLALGVENQEHLDVALAANGNAILHNVTIATLSAGEQSSKLGSIDWRDTGASCLSEMVAGLADAFRTDKVTLDRQISTALLTGIVASTERFSNNRTTSRVMATSAQLMAAGADQQLIAAKLQENHQISSIPNASVEKIATSEPEETPVESPDVLAIHHEEEEPSDPVTQAAEPVVSETIPTPQLPPIESPPEPNIIPEPVPAPAPEPETQPASTLSPEETQDQVISDVISPKNGPAEEPLLGGILSSTSEEAAEDARHQLDEQQNKTILSHSYLNGSSADQPQINSSAESEENKMVDIFSEAPSSSTIPPQEADIVEPPAPPVAPAVPDVGTVSPQPAAGGLPLQPPLPPDFSTLPPTPVETVSNKPSAPVVDSGQSTLSPNDDPSQFKIPQ